MIDEPVLMKLSEVRQLLGVSREQVYGMSSRDEITAVPLGRQIYYSRDSVKLWMKKNGVEKQQRRY